MNIQILHLVEGARKAKGLTVIIDVFRAFSTACFLKANGASHIIPLADITLAYQMKSLNPSFILIGERGGVMQPGFDYGNSPFQVKDIDFSGKTILLTTSAGTQGIQNAKGATEILTGSFLNASAIITYIRKIKPEEISLVCMGHEARIPTEEDTLLAEYIQSSLEGNPFDLTNLAEKLRYTSGKRFFNPQTQDSQPKEDFYLCLEPNRFNFVLKANPLNNPIFSVLGKLETEANLVELVEEYP